MRIYLIIFLFTLVINNKGIFSQVNEYTVITKSGEVTLIDKLSKDPRMISTGYKLQVGNKIELKRGSYVVIVDTNMRSIELNKEGIYNLSDISNFTTAKRNSIMENITKFILAEMKSSNDNYKEMKTLGAVVRKPINKIDVAIPHNTVLLDSLYTFSWYSPNNKEPQYLLRIFNQAGNTIFMKEVMDTIISMDMSKFNLSYNQDYFWTVFEKSMSEPKIDSISFRLLNPKERKNIISDIQTLNTDFNIEESPYNNLLLARFLRSLNLNLEALNYFNKAKQLNPTSELYWYEYLKFLTDVGLERRAIQEWIDSPFNVKSNENQIE